MSETGRRERRFFPTKVQAQTFVEQTETRVKNQGVSPNGLSAIHREVAAAAFRLLEGKPPACLLEIVQAHLARCEQRDRSITFSALHDAFLSAKAGRSEPYKRQIQGTVTRLSKLAEISVSEIEPGDIERELQGLPPSSRNGHLRVAKALFNFAIRRGWAATNPVAKLEFDEIPNEEVKILPNNEVQKLLTVCSDTEPGLLPYHFFAFFAGIRPQELERMEWGHVHLDELHILLPAELTKTGSRRVIEIEATLAGWLGWYIEKFGIQSGPVTPTKNLRKRLRAVREAAGITHWVQDVMRHSYASNYLAKFESVDKLRANLGHRSDAVLWNNYHRAVLKKDAEKFWAIFPAKAHPNITAFKAG